MYALSIDTTDAAFNLALEEVLFESLSPENPGIFLIWRNGPSIIVGRHQNTAAEVNAAWCREHGIAVVRRPTGGGAVYHDLGNVNFSFLSWVDKNRLSGFEEFMEPMVQALRDLGIDAAYTSRNDITVDGRKVCGTAQRRTGQRMLHHGCLLVDTDTSALSGALAADPEKFRSKGVASHRARVANLREFMPASLTSEECMQAVIEAMTRRCAEGRMELPPELLARAEALAQEKYRSWEWTYGRSPDFEMKNRRRFPGGTLEVRLNTHGGCIREIAFYGDYMAAEANTALCGALGGVPLTREALRETLACFDIAALFGAITEDEIVETILG
jgi:lipoate-protein ligase A